MKTIKVAFVDFWHQFNIKESVFYTILDKHFDIIITDVKDAEYVFFSCFGLKHLEATNDQILIFYTGENFVPDFNQCDYAIGFEHMDYGDRYIRFPVYALSEDDVRKAECKHIINDKKRFLASKESFCSFTVSNKRGDDIRKKVFDLFNTYKRVDSGGKWMNNIGGAVVDKFSFDAKHKFSIVLENSSHPGYTTEKLLQCFAAQTLPIYWGDPHITNVFNPDAFIIINDLTTIGNVLEKVMQIDQNDDIYMKYIEQPIYVDESKGYETLYFDLEHFILNIISQPLESAQRRNRVYWGNDTIQKLQQFSRDRKILNGEANLVLYFKLLYSCIKKKIHCFFYECRTYIK